MKRDPDKGELSWTQGAGSEEYVVDELCALSFVCWLWPAAMDKELATQPPYPNYSTLAPRWWSPPAGGPLPRRRSAAC
jgi:hypothetical protein